MHKILQEKGLVKIENFKRNPNKTNYIYILTPKELRKNKTHNKFHEKEKMKEYDELKKELE